MGMDFGDGPDLDAVREERLAATQKAESKEENKNDTAYTVLGAITLSGEDHLLLVGQDKRWYKAKKIGEYRRDEKNRTPLVPIYGEVEPFSEEDKQYFM